MSSVIAFIQIPRRLYASSFVNSGIVGLPAVAPALPQVSVSAVSGASGRVLAAWSGRIQANSNPVFSHFGYSLNGGASWTLDGSNSLVTNDGAVVDSTREFRSFFTVPPSVPIIVGFFIWALNGNCSIYGDGNGFATMTVEVE